MYKNTSFAIPLAMALAAVPAIVRSQSTEPTIEISANHGHIFTVGEKSPARIVKAWPGSFESFDFGEHPKIPNAKFIYIQLKPDAKMGSTTTLTLILDDGEGNEFTKAYVLERINGTPSRNKTLIENQAVYAANPQTPQPAIPLTASPSPKSVTPKQTEQQVTKGDRLKVSHEFIGASSSGSLESEKPKKGDESIPVVDRPQSKDAEVTDQVKPKPTEQVEEPQSESLPLIRAPKTLHARATVESPSKKQLIERSSLDNFGIANHLLKGLYQAERLKQINPSKAQFGQAQSMARLLRRGHSVDKALRTTGLPPITFDNLLGHGGVGK